MKQLSPLHHVRPSDINYTTWLWLQKTEPDRPWADFEIKVHRFASALFATSVCSMVGNGANTLFWTDKWLHSQSLLQIALALTNRVSMKIRRRRSVQAALTANGWVSMKIRRCRLVQTLSGSLPAQVLFEFLLVWDLLQEVQLHPNVEDQHRWLPSSSGLYSASSAYMRFHGGATTFEPAKRIWKTSPPPPRVASISFGLHLSTDVGQLID
jgi:hypothetical protein